jgi:hypothetical protein
MRHFNGNYYTAANNVECRSCINQLSCVRKFLTIENQVCVRWALVVYPLSFSIFRDAAHSDF